MVDVEYMLRYVVCTVSALHKVKTVTREKSGKAAYSMVGEQKYP